MQISLVTHFVGAAHRALSYGQIHKNKLVAYALKEEALMSIDNALCCRGLGKALRLEILSIREAIVKEMQI